MNNRVINQASSKQSIAGPLIPIMASKSSIQGLARAVSKLSHDELQDKYLRCHEENQNLKKTIKDLENSSKLANTRYNKSKQATIVPGQTSSNREQIAVLEASIAELHRKNDKLKRQLQLQAVKETPSKKRTSEYAHVKSRVSTIRREHNQSAVDQESRTSRAELLERTEHEVRDLREKLTQMDNQLMDQREEIQMKDAEIEEITDELKRVFETSEADKRNLEYNLQEMQKRLAEQSHQGNIGTVRLTREKDIKDKKISELQTKFDLLQEQLNKREGELDSAKRDLQNLQREVTYHKEHHDMIAAERKSLAITSSVSSQQLAQMQHLESENKILHESIKNMTDAAVSGESDNNRRRQLDVLQTRVNTLESQVRDEMKEKSEILGKLAHEQRMHAESQEDLRQHKKQFRELTSTHARLAKQMQYFSTESGLEMKEIEDALVMVRSKNEMEKTKTEMDKVTLSVPNEHESDMKRELQHLSLSHAETICELDKNRKMLKMQHELTRDFQVKAEAAEKKVFEMEREHAAKLQEYKKMLDGRSERVKKLQKQIKDIAYGTHQYGVKPHLATEVPDTFDHVSLKKGENLFEISIVRAVLKDEVKSLFDGQEPSTFITYDFFEHQSESTQVRPGLEPQFGSASRYIVPVTDNLLQYLQSGTMQVDLHRHCGTDYETLAVGQVKFSHVLLEGRHGSNRKLAATVVLRGVGRPETVFAEVHYWIRIRLPLDQAIRDFKARAKAADYDTLNRKGTSLQHITDTSELATSATTIATQPSNTHNHTYEDDDVVKTNVLQIAIIACGNLIARRPNTQPAAFVGYAFYRFEDYTTQTITASNDPLFDDLQRYPVTMDEDLHNYLQSGELYMYVVDDADPSSDDSELGFLCLPLKDLANNQAIMGSFNLKGNHSDSASTIKVLLKWEHTYEKTPNFVPYPLTTTASPPPTTTPITTTTMADSGIKSDFTGVATNASRPRVASESIANTHPTITDTNTTPTRDHAATTIQSAFRYHKRKSDNKKATQDAQLKRQDDAAVKIQAAFRGHRSRILSPKTQAVPLTQSLSTTTPTSTLAAATPTPTPTPRSDIVKSSSKSSPKNKKRKNIPPLRVVVHSFKFDKNSALMTDDGIRDLFVGYTMFETDYGICDSDTFRKPPMDKEIVHLNFEKIFEFNGEDDESVSNRSALRQATKNMLKAKTWIVTFEVSTDPQDDEEDELRCVGIAQLDIFKLFLRQSVLVETWKPFYDQQAWFENKQLVQIGQIKLTLDIMGALRSLIRT